jgi:phosphoenolpyruvate synthase/pyruvate phosphate dikinase
MRRMHHLVRLGEAADANEFGGKAARLARLTAEGFPVPGGVVIPQSVLVDHLRCTGLDSPNFISAKNLQNL